MDDDEPTNSIRTEAWTNATDDTTAMVEVNTLWNGNQVVTVDYTLLTVILTTLGFTIQP